MKQVIHTDSAPAAIGPYSQAIQIGDLLFVSGQVPIDPSTGAIVEGDVKAQAQQSLNKFFQEPFPARSAVQVARLPKDAKVEIEAIAQL